MLFREKYKLQKLLYYFSISVASQRLDHKKFWGSRQQMLAGKVIADWIDPEGGNLDPIFGVILQPTGGRITSI